MYDIKCEVIEVDGKNFCTGAAKTKIGEVFITGVKTPSPNGICAKAFGMLLPIVTAMRFSEEIPWEKGQSSYQVVCPDNKVKFKLSRIQNSES